MEKYDNIVKSSEIRKLVDKKMYQKALQILDTMEIGKIKVLTDLSVFAEVYMQTERYEDAEKLLLRLRERSNSRRVVYQLIKLSIKRKQAEAAEEYYKEYVAIAPRDSEKYILRYRIDKMKGADEQALITTLETLKEYDYIEKWSYELAKLYHKAGMKEKCIRECNDIILWFGEGVIVEKARMLKEFYLGKPKQPEENKEDAKVREEENQLKTKDLSSITHEVKAILEAEMKESGLEPKVDFSCVLEELVEADEVEDNPEVSVTEEPKAGEKEESEELEESAGVETVKQGVDEGHSALDDPAVMGALGCYRYIPSIAEQIRTFLDGIITADRIDSFAITGASRSGKTELAKAIVRTLLQLGICKDYRLAKIRGARLNLVDLTSQYERLRKSFIIVEQVGELQPETVEALCQMVDDLDGEAVLILEGREEELSQLLQEESRLEAMIAASLQIDDYTREDLIELSKEYFMRKEFEVEEDAWMCLETMCNQIAMNVHKEQRLHSLIKQLDSIIDRVEKRCLEGITLGSKGEGSSIGDLSIIVASDF